MVVGSQARMQRNVLSHNVLLIVKERTEREEDEEGGDQQPSVPAFNVKNDLKNIPRFLEIESRPLKCNTMSKRNASSLNCLDRKRDIKGIARTFLSFYVKYYVFVYIK